jgi:gliding motility-associated-like protein
MLLRLKLLFLFLVLTALVCAQNNLPPACGQKEFTQQLYRLHPEFKKRHDAQEGLLYMQRTQRLKTISEAFRLSNSTVVLPVVIHIIHNNGQENISDAQVKQGIKYLNNAFAASGFYITNGSTNTHIQFCMAERDPDGNATSGITRNVSAYTVMGGDTYAADDQHVKNIIRWNPYNYINVWVVQSIPGDVVGYSTLPEAHGTEYEGIVMEAAYFGSTEVNNVVLIHEIGHYLGLYHTFEGGCTNNDCQLDGDKECDTPPDQTTSYISCDASMNSCTTDVLSGFNTDQPDLTQDYMDYGNFNCMKVFTPGQSERMNWFVQNVLFSLLNCKSCQPPCPAPPVAIFSASASKVPVNTQITFTNNSVNATHYKWYVDGVEAATTKNLIKFFAVQGSHVITLLASGDDILCDSTIKSDTVIVTCPVKAGFTYTPGVIKAAQTVVFSDTATGASSYTWKVNGVMQATSPNFSYTFTPAGVYTVTQVASGICTDSISVHLSVYDSAGNIPADICKPVTFQKMIVTNNQVIWGMNVTRDSGYVLCGTYAVPFVDGAGGAYVLKLNRGGGEEWARYINPFSDETLRSIKENADGSFIACGIEYTITQELHSKAIVMKLDAKGNILWSKKFGRVNSKQDVALDITQTSDGGYAFCGATHDDDFRITDWLVSKTDAIGNVVWAKTLDNGFYERAYSIISKGDTLIIAGIRTLTTGLRSEIVITKMLAADGKIIGNQSYGVGNRSVENTRIFKIDGGYLIGAESVADGFYYADMDQLAMQIDESLQPIRAVKVAEDIYGSPSTGINPTADGGFITARMSEGYYGPNYTDSSWMSIAKIDPNWNLEWIKQYPLAYEDGHTVYTPKAVFQTPDGGYVTGETTAKKGDYGEHFRIIKTDSKGNTPGCIVNRFSANIEIQPVYTAAFNWGSINNIIFDDPASPNLAIRENRVEPVSIVQRCSTSDCDSIKLRGSTSVCSLADTVTYSAGRNAACVSSVLWQIDTSMASIVSYTDTTVRLLFKKAGKVSLMASIFTACKVLQDSIMITTNDSRKTLDLGPDIQLCNNSTVKLSAGNGFKKYHWNTGSSDSSLTAYLPGKYYVTVSDYCDNNFSDTIVISVATAIKLNLSANAARCDQDSLFLTATPGFKSYTWSPDYHTSSVSGNSIKVWPAIDTTYIVVATINEYCTVTDSTRVTVKKFSPISIGNDTTFCAGGAVKLHAPPGFARYLWQDGSRDDNYLATQKGMYWLSALNANGCYSKDTMLVIDVYPLPVINLGRDGTLCLNNNILHAGTGQKNYAWQDGSADSVFRVNEAGTYSVTVINGHGCVNADTINVTEIIAGPSGFLVHDISMCENGTAQLNPMGSWASYLWSTGDAKSSITIKQPGQYWLQVTDYNACVGRDTVSVVIKDDCPKVVYFPNAFTPNDDGLNDIFKPFTAAPLEKYSLKIYNRWGQMIFTSNDPLQGWNGKYRSVVITPGVYVYLCSYKFYNKAQGMMKGTVVVVK